MPIEYEVHIECPTTKQPVSTGLKVEYREFGENKPYGTFNCPACGQAHPWAYDRAQIHPVAR